MKQQWIWDVEIYPNLFLLGAKIPGTDIRKRFQLSPLADNRQEMVVWLRDEVETMIGFNSVYYDYLMLHRLITKYMNTRGSVAAYQMYKYSAKTVKGIGNYPVRSPLRKQIDLFKINHFDNKARMTSLKLLEFNLRAKNLQSLPYTFDMELNRQQIFDIIAYNDNDVDATEKLYFETLPEIELREKLSGKYGIDFTNYNGTKIGEHILIKKITDKLGEDVLYDQVPTASGDFRKVVRNTKRDEMDLSEVVFDYIHFKTEPFQKILNWFKSRVITETKGALVDLPFSELESLEPHYKVIKKKGKQKNLNIIYKGFQYDFGVGGIHGCIEPGVYEADDDYDIIDIDVESYYPKLSIENKFYPEHIGPEFCSIYESIFQERKLYPKKTHKTENLALKLALNGSYGKSNSAYSALGDPKYTMLTTVNGQLLLCMVAENIMERIPQCQMLQINTDGLTIKCKKVYKSLVIAICKEWEKLTKLNLEFAYYSRMIIKDVNNYIGVYEDNTAKRKGAAFIYKQQPGELELHKNYSQLVVPKALESYFVDGVLPEDFFQNHTDIYDFFKRTKIDRTSRMVLRDYDKNGEIRSDVLGQNISRYLITGKYRKNKETKQFEKTGQGKTLIKIMPPLYKKGKTEEREFNVEEGWLCTVVNQLPDDLETLRGIIDYDYYTEQAYNVINLIIGENDN